MVGGGCRRDEGTGGLGALVSVGGVAVLVVGEVKGRPAKARGALTLDIKDSNVL